MLSSSQLNGFNSSSFLSKPDPYWINGTEVGSNTLSGSPQSSNTFNLVMWRWFNPSGFSNHSPDGYLDELRVTKGVARYTSTFTPPLTPFPNH